MSLGQLYETLVLRDIMFYFLPGGVMILGLGLLLGLQSPGAWKSALAAASSVNTWAVVAVLAVLAYLCGHILCMIHGRTVGKLREMDRPGLMGGFLQTAHHGSEALGFALDLRKSLAKALTGQVRAAHETSMLKTHDVVQLYFLADKYVRLKSPDLYTLYVSRLTATSHFTGEMGVVCLILGCSCGSFLLTGSLSPVAVVGAIAILCLLSYLFVRQSIADCKELVWNVIQATYLLQLEEERAKPRNMRRIRASQPGLWRLVHRQRDCSIGASLLNED